MAQIKKDTNLRKAVLQAAVTGKLISSVCHPELDSGTLETGRQLLDRIIAERNKKLLEETKKNHTDLQISTKSAGKKSDLRSKSQIRVTKKELPPITEDEIPFEIPENWCWCRIDDLFSHNTGKALNKSENKEGTELEYITTSNLYWNYFELNNLKTMLFKDSEIEKCTVRKGDLLVCEGGEVGRTAIWTFDREICIQNHIHRLRAYESSLNTKFYYYVMFLYKEGKVINAYAKGIGIKGLSSNALGSIIVPLPPLAVQNAIVAKLEQVLPLVDAYENALLQKEELKGALKDKVKNAILQEAVQGKLVPQIAGEGSAKDLLAEIKKNRTDLQVSTKSAGKKSDLRSKSQIRVTKKELPPITEDEIPFEIPESWCWCRLGEIVYNNGQKTPDKKFSYIDIGSIDNINQKLNEKENLILPEKAPSRARKIVKKGDIIYSTVRPYLHNMCIIDKDFSEEPIASTGFAVMSCCDAIYNKFLFYYLLSPIFDNYANDTENSKGVAYPAINDDKLYKGLVPLPPLAEQKRIVAAVEELLPLCERLGR